MHSNSRDSLVDSHLGHSSCMRPWILGSDRTNPLANAIAKVGSGWHSIAFDQEENTREYEKGDPKGGFLVKLIFRKLKLRVKLKPLQAKVGGCSTLREETLCWMIVVSENWEAKLKPSQAKVGGCSTLRDETLCWMVVVKLTIWITWAVSIFSSQHVTNVGKGVNKSIPFFSTKDLLQRFGIFFFQCQC